MKYLIASDIHGSLYYTNILKSLIEKENPNKIILLGDLYYHGPRNPFPQDYDPKGVCEYLNSIKSKLIVIKGNCDAEVDEMISNFKFKKSYTLVHNGKTIFFTHGHKYNIDNFPETDFDIMIYGHTHKGFIEYKNGKIIANPGSLPLPKEGSDRSYMIIENNRIVLKGMRANELSQLSF